MGAGTGVVTSTAAMGADVTVIVTVSTIGAAGNPGGVRTEGDAGGPR